MQFSRFRRRVPKKKNQHWSSSTTSNAFSFRDKCFSVFPRFEIWFLFFRSTQQSAPPVQWRRRRRRWWWWCRHGRSWFCHFSDFELFSPFFLFFSSLFEKKIWFLFFLCLFQSSHKRSKIFFNRICTTITRKNALLSRVYRCEGERALLNGKKYSRRTFLCREFSIVHLRKEEI